MKAKATILRCVPVEVRAAFEPRGELKGFRSLGVPGPTTFYSVSAAERRRITFKGFQDFYQKAKARIWP